MKNWLTVVLLMVGSMGFAQDSVEKRLGDFDEIKVYDLINVQLIQSNEGNRAEITGDKQEEVELVNNNGTLKVRMRFGKNYEGSKTVVYVYHSGLKLIDANEGSVIYADSPIEQYQIDLRAQEGASIELKLNVQDLKAKAVTGGTIEVSGSAHRQDITLTTGGIYDGKQIDSEAVYVNVKAAGEAYVRADRLAEVKVMAGGDVFVYGPPEKVNEKTVLGGRIKIME